MRERPSETKGHGGPGRPGLKLLAWCVYDWGNSAFPAVILSFVFAPYFTQKVAETATLGTAAWGRAITISALAIAALSPFLGAIGDKRGRRKPWLAAFSALSVGAVAGMWFVHPVPEDVLLALVLVAVANLGFELAIVFYNAMLPGLVPASRLGRASGWGWGLGYAGGLACMGVAWFGLIEAEPPPFGLSVQAAEHVRAAAPLAAAWFALFALPLFAIVPDQPATGTPMGRAVREGLAEVWHTVRGLRRFPNVAWFLGAHLAFIDGLNTLFVFGGIYAAGTFGMELTEVLRFGITLNVAAGIGATLFAWIDDWIGARRVLLISLVALIALTATLLVIESKAWFWALGVVLGAFFGPVQSASRSLMARLAPKGMRTEMFGLFSLSGKATAFAGPALLSWVTLAFDSQRAGMATILIFFAAGILLLVPVREPGAAQAHA